MRLTEILALGALAGLCACQPPAPPKSPAERLARAAAMTPSDPRLGGLYAHACKACHTVAGSGAPLAGDRAAWAPRAAKGMSALMKNVVTGYKGMPAGGQCFACTSQDDQDLIRFMADQPVT